MYVKTHSVICLTGFRVRYVCQNSQCDMFDRIQSTVCMSKLSVVCLTGFRV